MGVRAIYVAIRTGKTVGDAKREIDSNRRSGYGFWGAAGGAVNSTKQQAYAAQAERGGAYDTESWRDYVDR